MSYDLPDFHIAHSEKIEWMIETAGWALEPVSADPTAVPPAAGYCYTIGLPALVNFAEIAIFGLTPVAANGLLGLVVDLLQGGTDIPLGVELVGLLDGDQRCAFAPIAVDECHDMFVTARSWYRGRPFDIAQLLWPDRNGFLPTEAGYAQHMRLAQPVIGSLVR